MFKLPDSMRDLLTEATLRLMNFSITAYTRLRLEREAKLARTLNPPIDYYLDSHTEDISIDNGQRMIRVRIVYGPYWSNDQEDDL